MQSINYFNVKSPLKEKSYKFAVDIVKLSQKLTNNKEFVLSRQILRSGTAIGAIIRESEHAESKADFIHKLSISLKEANETEYWLMLLADTEYITKEEFFKLHANCNELISMLVASIKTLKSKKENSKK